ncbi:MAG: ATP-dependent DNA helicase RecG [Fusobacteriaceae bacterium]
MKENIIYNEIYRDISDLTFPKLTEKDKKELKKLKSLKINCIYDLLYYFPRAYDNRTNLKKINEVGDNEYVVIKATVAAILPTNSYDTNKKLVKIRVMDDSGTMDLVWFSSPYIAKTLKIGETYFFIGVAKRSYGLSMINPEYKYISKKNIGEEKGEILPIYSSVKNINQNILRKFIKMALVNFKKNFSDNIPKEIIDKYKIISRVEALYYIHFPKNERYLEEARRRFAIEELLILEMGILSSRYTNDLKNEKLYKLEDKKELVKSFLKKMKFELTLAQKRVITEIYRDLLQGKIISRLIQGDVGSGKTIVSMILLLYMVENSYQGVIMAPTEILATQHYLGNKDDFLELGIKIELLTGSLTAKNKLKVLEKIKNGDIDIVIGTHALIQDSVEFKKLGLIVIDEQHKFGVEQRKIIRDKGILSNLIVMSATPIPRSLALSIYGDLDVSIIDELPPGRKKIKTKHISNDSDIKKMYNFIQKNLDEGRQAYFIAPLIEESEKLSTKSVIELEEEVKKNLPNFKIGILHGKLNSKEKDKIMHEFKNKELDIIVATTVIEVGVNVPNASIIVISDSERFGLSSLHQLRGRVGRGEHSSYCFLISKTKNETSNLRMSIMEQTQDGFKIAEEDLKLRKPGEIFGTRQSGVTDLKFIDIVHDIKTIKQIRDECIEYLEKNSGEIKNEYLKIDVEKKFV